MIDRMDNIVDSLSRLFFPFKVVCMFRMVSTKFQLLKKKEKERFLKKRKKKIKKEKTLLNLDFDGKRERLEESNYIGLHNVTVWSEKKDIYETINHHKNIKKSRCHKLFTHAVTGFLKYVPCFHLRFSSNEQNYVVTANQFSKRMRKHSVALSLNILT